MTEDHAFALRARVSVLSQQLRFGRFALLSELSEHIRLTILLRVLYSNKTLVRLLQLTLRIDNYMHSIALLANTSSCH